MKIEIDSELHLELLNESHAPEIFELTERNRLYLDKWLPWVKYTKSKEDTLMFIKNSTEQYKNKTGMQTVIKYKDKITGLIGLVEISYVRNVTEIGYWLGEEYMGKGIMTMACKALTDHTFDNFNVKRINIICDVNNTASQNVPARVGYFNQGILKRDNFLNGEYIDHYHFVMRRHEWEK